MRSRPLHLLPLGLLLILAGCSLSPRKLPLGTSTGGNVTPYRPYDGGPHLEPIPPRGDSGCDIAAPIPDGLGGCWQCQGNQDCPAPLLCETDPVALDQHRCVQCTLVQPACPGTGALCTAQGECTFDCRLKPTACATLQGGFCDADGGHTCLAGCLRNANCPPKAPFCDPGSQACSACVLDGGPGTAGGCAAGEVCNAGPSPGVAPGCAPDCRLNAGASCVPGLCDADAGSFLNPGIVGCLPGLCTGSQDCGGARPFCDPATGVCAACGTGADCVAQSIGQAFCNGDACTATCGGAATCGSEQCLPLPALGTNCLCQSDADCKGQRLAPDCLPFGVLLRGECGCRIDAGDCPKETVCESRPEVLEHFYPGAGGTLGVRSLCVPRCADGGSSCQGIAADPVCEPASGYCVGCLTDGQCLIRGGDAGSAHCVPTPSGTWPATGGGFCGCVSGSCDGGQTCANPGQPGSSCRDPCLYTPTGDDSCLYGVAGRAAICNTETGLCQRCATDRDCVGASGTGLSGDPVLTPACSSAGDCVECNSSSDCDAIRKPGCSPATHLCGTCQTFNDCPASNLDAGLIYSCVSSPNQFSLSVCAIGCTPPKGRCPLAVPICDPVLAACVQCEGDGDCDGGFCNQGLCSASPP